MSIPNQINPRFLADYLEIISRAVFQASLSWKQIEDCWDEFKAAFHDFDPNKVAAFNAADVERLMQYPGIVHSRKKILATIKNAKTILELDAKHSGFAKYLHSKSSYEELSKDLRKSFSFMGEVSVYYFLFRVKEPVPDFEEWIQTVEGDHPRIKEMVEAAE